MRDARTSFLYCICEVHVDRFESCHPDENLIPEVGHQSGFRDFVVLKITLKVGYPWLRFFYDLQIIEDTRFHIIVETLNARDMEFL